MRASSPREMAVATVLHIGYKHIRVDAPHEYHQSNLFYQIEPRS